MSIKKIMIRQFGHPSGNLGKLAGRIMSFSNKELGRWAIEKIKAEKDSRILEIGYGTGDTFLQLAKYLTNGFIAGVDHSALMYRQASGKCKELLKEDKAVLHHGTAWDMEYEEESFDIVFAANVHFFWQSPKLEFTKIAGLLKYQGRIVILFQPRWIKSEEELYKLAYQTRIHLHEAGFYGIRTDFKPIKPFGAVCVSGVK